jgi:uncharacterized UBP type Zn finger protein
MTESGMFVDPNSLTSEEKEVYAVRIQICNNCEYKNSISICIKCGCVLAIKARIPAFHCPLKKW